MRIRFSQRVLFVMVAAAVAGGPLWAQTQGAAKSVTNENRLFQRFIEDGAVIPGGWVEGQARLQFFDDGEAVSLSPIIAFNVAEDIELGGRVGLLSYNPDPGGTETGFTDMDLYGKIRLTMQPTQFALGVLLKLPSGDEKKSTLHGTGEMDVAFFGGVRHDFKSLTFVASGGFRINQDPEPGAVVPGLPASAVPEGELSLQLGVGLIVPFTPKLSGVAETSFETERIDGAGSDFRVTLGSEYRAGESFGMRFAAAGGIGDAAPNFEAIGSVVLFF